MDNDLLNPYQPPKSISYQEPLDPIDVGDKVSIDRALSLSWKIGFRNIETVMIILICLYWPGYILMSVLTHHVFDPSATWIPPLLEGGLDFTLFIIADAAFYYLGLRTIVGEHPGAGESLRVGLQAFGVMFITRLLASILSLFGLLLLIIPGIYLYFRWYFIDPVVISEGISAEMALRRSWKLTKGNVATLVVAQILATFTFFLPAILLNVTFNFIEFSNWWVDGLKAIVGHVLIPFFVFFNCVLFVQFRRQYSEIREES